ncbi:hypothetical protein FRA_50c14620 [Francisella sp. W12-1067]|nr:hypothetical protein FRA_50c14620 [Francisella sp. W12-1067]
MLRTPSGLTNLKSKDKKIRLFIKPPQKEELPEKPIYREVFTRAGTIKLQVNNLPNGDRLKIEKYGLKNIPIAKYVNQDDDFTMLKKALIQCSSNNDKRNLFTQATNLKDLCSVACKRRKFGKGSTESLNKLIELLNLKTFTNIRNQIIDVNYPLRQRDIRSFAFFEKKFNQAVQDAKSVLPKTDIRTIEEITHQFLENYFSSKK